MASSSAASTMLVLVALSLTIHHAVVVVEGRGLASRPRAQVKASTNGSALIYSPTGQSDNTYRAWSFTPGRSSYYGAKAKLSVHQLPEVATNQQSFAFIQVCNDQSAGGVDAIQAGWLVSPDVFGDARTHLFVYWTAGNRGCYNVQCDGFVVLSGSPVVPGSVLDPAASYAGILKSITLTISKDGESGNWYLTYEDEVTTTQVGYWPNSLFSGLADRATQNGYGGLVSASVDSSRNPPMGSGRRATEGEGRAASFKNLQYLDQNYEASDYSRLSTQADKPQCYDIRLFPDNGEGVHFYYGGPAGC